MILTVTLNPALDLWAEAPHVVPGPKLRLSTPRRDPGGGGINVARVISRLGGKPRALAALGGAVGAQLAALIEAEGLELIRFDAPGETRQSLTVRDAATGGEYRFVLPGEVWDNARTDKALKAIAKASGQGLVVLSGSQPPGVPDDFTWQLGQSLGGARLIVDTSGPALNAIATQKSPGISVLRMDQAEASSLAGADLSGLGETLAFGRALLERGAARCIVLARGAEGSVLVSEQGQWACRPPAVSVLSKVGAGDSFTAAFALALERGASLPEALQLGTAAAAAAVITPGTDLCHAQDVQRLKPECRIEPLAVP